MSKHFRGSRHDGDSHFILLTQAKETFHYARKHIDETRRHAARVTRQQLMKGGENVERGVRCGRCGARAWLEEAEGHAFILVEVDGRPHADRCSGGLEKDGLVSARADSERADAEGVSKPSRVGRCWGVMGETGELFARYETWMRCEGGLSSAPLEEVWSIFEACEYLEAKFQAALPAYYEDVSKLSAIEREAPC